jgi:hypothetical protein
VQAPPAFDLKKDAQSLQPSPKQSRAVSRAIQGERQKREASICACQSDAVGEESDGPPKQSREVPACKPGFCICGDIYHASPAMRARRLSAGIRVRRPTFTIRNLFSEMRE